MIYNLRPMIYILIFLFTLFTPVKAHAQSVELSLNPPVVEAIIAPNKKFTQVFNFKTSQSGVVVIPELHLVKPSGTDGHSTIDPSPVNPSSIPLVVTSSPALGARVALAGNELPITLTIESASTDLSQDVYLALLLRVEPKDSFEKASLASPIISALILSTITVDGTLPINLEIENFDPPVVHDSWLPLTISPILKNSTPIKIRPQGKYEIVSPLGKVIVNLPLYPNLVLGKSSRTIESMIQEIPGNLDWSPKWSNIGPHKLRLTIETQGGTTISQTEKLVWIFPFRGFIILVLLVIIIYRLTQRKQLSTLDN